ncbi:MAG: polymerase III, delta prime subunit protein [Microgenomates group bacterium GW2011_GWC1_41_20]|uniref:Polymerase III delta subunit protein n=6 Tax=Candidatus Woeseibacteriota TaxID=1752722 RepID=A0A0G0WYB3_9BACT|nr:MAG: polymerase III delta subunit protein [Candidatus Woesebacteria bacterium GW2011_GWB1_40_12]KKR89882.1 MAG: polymerase III delta subunit protein [Candidatus Woesebacteria bacterium GW2011_GWD1_41_12]KKR99541.1 MAG: polymerase III, delta prime subunit protein [Microgenomates group bacterium GW2011_GWC1_41_20]KKS05275.1 MAG: polymerase III delta subunit protein [Candidatus Woesebacteria bacterium GW2011_GWE1_41_24]KKS17774.1 MAG: polymerase III delta subunit protein [Candidatus Woesebacter
MHAYLLTGQGISDYGPAVSKLANKLKAKILEFPLKKIEDVRNLNNLLRLSFDKPTLIYCNNIHDAGEEALNAFLKNLEEPQENIFFALTSTSPRRVLPTIVSRCQIVRIKSGDSEPMDQNIEEIQTFFKMTTGEKLFYIDKIKDRARAIEFAENMVNFMHRSLHENGLKYDVGLKNIDLALKTLSRLKGNGNVNLQLSNFVINYLN